MKKQNPRIITYRYITNTPYHIAICEEGINNYPINNNFHFKFYEVPLDFDIKKDVDQITSLYLRHQCHNQGQTIKVKFHPKQL